MSLKFEYFSGIVLPDPDPRNLGRYKVHIPELQLRMGKSSGILCRNKIHNYRVNDSEDGVYGCYMPLHAGTKVIVAIANSDYSSASIVRINIHEKDFDKQNTLPFNVSDKSRDDLYLLLRTPKYDSLIAIMEDTVVADEPDNSLHIYHHNGETRIIINKDGIHIDTVHNLSATIGGNSSIVVSGNCGISVNGSTDIVSGGVTNIVSGGNVNVDAPMINLNSGASAPGPIFGYDTFPASDKELKLRNSDKNL